MSQPLLSIGMIVKNEERSLENCLKALTPLRQAIPCELVIADTGSTDNTKEIAKNYADILFDFTWIDDFSAARNAVMDKCSGKWYLSIDADEYLNSSVDEITDFLTSSLSDQKLFATISIRNHHDTSMNGTFTTIDVPRMVRMDTNIRYSGIIHEAFEISDFKKMHILSNTIFDHDGYTQITSQHLKEKEARNLKLLEKHLNNNPDDIRCILLCLEASSLNKSKRKHYTEYAFKKLTELSSDNSTTSDLFGAACASTALAYALTDNNAKFLEFTTWANKVFPEDYHILIDVNFYLSEYYHQKKDFVSCEKHCTQYLNSLKKYSAKSSSELDTTFASPLKCIDITHKSTLISYLISSLVTQEKFIEAEALVPELDFRDATLTTFTVFTEAIANKNCPESLVSKATDIYNDFFEKYNSGEIKEKRIYDSAISALTSVFSVKSDENNNLTNFSEIDGTIGISAKIATTENKKEIQTLLNQIENWEEFMPLALKKAILLRADLPNNFYLMLNSHLVLLINNLAKSSIEIAVPITEKYCGNEHCTSFSKTSFTFNLLLAILVNTEETLPNDIKAAFIKQLILVSDKFLSFCYNPKLLDNEAAVACITPLHLFSWYLVKANKLKESNPLEYIKTLRTAINKVPQSKQIVEFLIEEFKQEEEQKKQEQIKNAAPELVAMAEQLKIMLKAFPENSPELLAIKQSPMYKQVAFLIEE